CAAGGRGRGGELVGDERDRENQAPNDRPPPPRAGGRVIVGDVGVNHVVGSGRPNSSRPYLAKISFGSIQTTWPSRDSQTLRPMRACSRRASRFARSWASF